MSARRRKPGPPTSGEIGEYRVMSRTHVECIAKWNGDSWWPTHSIERRPDVWFVPLHDYPLVPGDEVREAFEWARETIGNYLPDETWEAIKNVFTFEEYLAQRKEREG